MNDPYIALWFVISAIMFIIEASTFNLITIWFAIGALGALIATALGYSVGIQVSVFFVISGILIAVLMPFARKTLSVRKQATNADRIIGAQGIVVEKIDEVTGTGQVKVMGGTWSAKTSDGSKFDVGDRVDILKIEGVKAVVAKRSE